MVDGYFFDTSALAKRYMVEKGTTWVVKMTSRPFQNHEVFLSQLTIVEVVSALARRIREGLSTSQDMVHLRASLKTQRRHWQVIGVTYAQIDKAQDFLTQYPLRAYDAM